MFVLFVSSPYLLIFGDDRVRGTREQMMLQVDLVRHRAGAGLVGRRFFSEFYYFMYFKDYVNVWIIEHGFYI